MRIRHSSLSMILLVVAVCSACGVDPDNAETIELDGSMASDVMHPMDAEPLDDAEPAVDAAISPDAGTMPDANLPMDPWSQLIGPCILEPADDPEEGVPFMDVLRTIDFEQLPSRISIEELSPIFRSVVAYALEIPIEELGNKLVRDEILAIKPLGVVVAGAFARGPDIDFLFLRSGLSRFYNCARGYPHTLVEFTELFGDLGQNESREIDSAAKCGPRRIFENNVDQIYMAETIVGSDVRETEILMAQHRQDGQLDFIVYDSDGQRTGQSTFPTVGGSEISGQGPYICMSCHVDTDSDPSAWTYDILFPDAGVCR